MVRFVLTRLGWGLITIVVISLVTFLATNVVPADPAKAALGKFATADQVAAYRAQQGLDRPVGQRYIEWVERLAEGDWGTSVLSNIKVTQLVEPRISRTLILALGAMLLAVPLAFAVGVHAAQHSGQPSDVGLSITALFVNSLPEFVIGLGMLVLFAVKIPVLPIESSAAAFGTGLEVPMAYVLPIITLALILTPYMARMVRANVREVSSHPFVRSAVLRGLQPRRIMWRHIVPNASLPVINVIALTTADLVGGVVIIESVFGLPGLGQLLVNSVSDKDIPVVQAIVLLIGSGYVLINLLADIGVLALNPRLRT